MRRVARFVLISAITFAAATALAPAHAQDLTPHEIIVCTDAASHEAADARVLDQAMQSFSYGGFAALERHMGPLRRAAERAPACYPETERRDGVVIVRSEDPSKGRLIQSALASASFGASNIVVDRNVYGGIFLILSSYAVETRRYGDAVAWADRGLALQPLNELLTSEKAAALNGARRYDEAYAIIRGALDDPRRALTLDRARFLRIAGVTLIDLERLDEAEAALNESIRLQPDNPIAHSELQYIAGLRAGAAPTEGVLTAPNAPKPETQ